MGRPPVCCCGGIDRPAAWRACCVFWLLHPQPCSKVHDSDAHHPKQQTDAGPPHERVLELLDLLRSEYTAHTVTVRVPPPLPQPPAAHGVRPGAVFYFAWGSQALPEQCRSNQDIPGNGGTAAGLRVETTRGHMLQALRVRKRSKGRVVDRRLFYSLVASLRRRERRGEIELRVHRICLCRKHTGLTCSLQSWPLNPRVVAPGKTNHQARCHSVSNAREIHI